MVALPSDVASSALPCIELVEKPLGTAKQWCRDSAIVKVALLVASLAQGRQTVPAAADRQWQQQQPKMPSRIGGGACAASMMGDCRFGTGT